MKKKTQIFPFARFFEQLNEIDTRELVLVQTSV